MDPLVEQEVDENIKTFCSMINNPHDFTTAVEMINGVFVRDALVRSLEIVPSSLIDGPSVSLSFAVELRRAEAFQVLLPQLRTRPWQA